MYGGNATPDTILHAISVAMATGSEGEALGLFGELVSLSVSPSETAVPPRDLSRDVLVGAAALLDAASGRDTQIAEWIADAGLEDELYRWTTAATNEVSDRFGPADGVPVVLEPVRGWGVLTMLLEDRAGTLTKEEASAKAAVDAIHDELMGEAPVFDWLPLGGVRRPSRPHAATVHVNLVLRYLATVWQLPSASSRRLVAIGTWNGVDYASAGDDAELATIIEDAGWTPITVQAGAWQYSDIRAEDASLVALARLVWPNFETLIARRRRGRALAVHGWTVAGVARAQESFAKDGWFQPRREGLITTSAVSYLTKSFADSPASARILGGKAHTGKTVIAQQLAGWLHSRAMWDVIVLRPDSRSIAEDAELSDIIAAARDIHLHGRRRPCLVVVEDLRPVDSVDLGSILATAASECEVSLLAIARYGDNGRRPWDSGNVATLNAIVTREQVFDLAERMVRHSSGTLALPDAATPDSVWDMTGGGDLVALEPLLRGHVYTTTPHAANVRWVVQLGLIEEGVWDECLTDQERDSLLAAGAVIIDGSIRASLSSSDRRRLEADEAAREEGIAEALELTLERYFGCPKSHSHDQVVVRLLLSASAYSPAALGEVMSRAVSLVRLQEWLRLRDVSTIVSVVRAVRTHIGEVSLTLLLTLAVDSLDSRRVPAGALARLVLMIDRLQVAWPGSDLTPRLVHWLKNDHGLERSLESNAYFSDRVSLALSASFLGSFEVYELVLRLMPKFLLGIETDRGSDLRALLVLEDAMDRCGRRYESATNATADRLADLPAFLEITAHPPVGFSALMAWLALSVRRRGGATDWMPLIELHGLAVLNGMGNATPGTISSGLGHLANTNRGFANKLVKALRGVSGVSGLELRDILRSRLISGPAGDAAELLRVVANVHAHLARELLFSEASGDAVPRDALAEALAARISRAVDIKGAGQLLPACHRIDEEFATGPGFAFALAEYLGIEFMQKALEYENRPSVVSYLLSGLWLAKASYRNDTTERALGLVIEHINQRDPWRQRFAARLGVSMSLDPDYGLEALRRISHSVSVERFVDIALSSHVLPETLSDVHRLARSAHPDFPMVFRGRIEARRSGRIEASWRARGAEALVFYTQLTATLRAGGDPTPLDTVISLLRATQDGDYAPATAHYWDRLVRGLRGRPGHVATILLHLHRFDERIAEQVLELLTVDDSPQGPETMDRGTSNSLAWSATATTERIVEDVRGQRSFLGQLLRQSTRELTTFTDLVVAINRINPAVVADLLEGIRGPVEQKYDGVTAVRLSTGAWASFMETFQYEQSTALQASTGLQLARVRIVNGDALGETVLSRRSDTGTVLRRVVQERWQNTIGFIASPQIVANLLRLSFMWDSAWGTSLSQVVSGDRLVRRLSNMWLPDLDQLPRLLHVLEVTKSTHVHQRLEGWLSSLGTSARLAFSRMSSDATGWLVREAGLEAETHRYALDGLVDRMTGDVATLLVPDPFEHWTRLGSAACALHAVGEGDRVPAHSAAERLLPGVEPAYLWWKAWSHQVSGDEEVKTRAWVVIEETLQTRMPPDHVAMALIAGVRLGYLQPEELERDSAAWSIAAFARLHLVAELCDTLSGAHRFGDWFRRLVPVLAARLSEPGMEFYQGFKRVASYKPLDEPMFYG
ncbi:hypothetical protein [Plantibacter sp. LMC-P-059a]|uniref:hypothetical protein n=1 Tax=Plantibacter sp. LMC-P-059a TaxID=3040297 RepID=UPI00254D5C86|nr:hypothetical protein [Plantibacter sp. LMC-P-059a]